MPRINQTRLEDGIPPWKPKPKRKCVGNWARRQEAGEGRLGGPRRCHAGGGVGVLIVYLLGLVKIHVSPEAAEGGLIGLVRNGDRICIDIPQRTIALEVDDTVLAQRRYEELARGARAWTPTDRDRVVSAALRAYAALTTSAACGAVRDVDQLLSPPAGSNDPGH